MRFLRLVAVAMTVVLLLATAALAQRTYDDDLVITLAYKGDFYAFPSRILDHHEIVNGTFAGDPLAIT